MVRARNLLHEVFASMPSRLPSRLIRTRDRATCTQVRPKSAMGPWLLGRSYPDSRDAIPAWIYDGDALRRRPTVWTKTQGASVPSCVHRYLQRTIDSDRLSLERTNVFHPQPGLKFWLVQNV